MMEFACVEKGERLRRVFFQNSKIPNLSLISAFRTFAQTTICMLVVGTVPYRFLFANNPFVKKETVRYQIIIRSVSTVAQKRLLAKNRIFLAVIC